MNITDRFLAFSLLGAEWVMWVLVVLSVISLAIMIERAVYFHGKRPNVATLAAELKQLLGRGDVEGAMKRLEERGGVAANVTRAALGEASRGVVAVTETAASELGLERLRLERNLAFLGTLGANAPFIGLFGTVIGIIQAFHDLSKNTQGGAGTVMAGISEALVATALGLLVAIPAVAAFNIFQRRTRALVGDADALVHVVLAHLPSRVDKAE
jgi:biopolymer transport protein ExbB